MPARSANRKDNPSSPPKTRDDAVSTRQTRSTRPTPAQEARDTVSRRAQRQIAQPGAVSEEVVADDVAADQSAEADNAFERFSTEGTDPEIERSDQGDSSSAGSDEFAALVVSEIVETLPVIDFHAQRVLSLVQLDTVEQLALDIRDPASTASRRFRDLRLSIEPCTSRQLIDIKMLTRRIAGLSRHEDLPSRSSRHNPALIFAKANLALFISYLLSLSMHSDGKKILELLFHLSSVDAFPSPFGFNDTSSEKLSTTMENMALDILTQAFIAGAHPPSAKRDFDPEESLAELFVANSEEPALLNHKVSEDLLKARRSDISQRLSSRKRKVYLSELREQYPWEAFVKRVSAWTKRMESRLNRHINAQGGAQSIADKIESGELDATPSPELGRPVGRKSRTSAEIRRQYEDLTPHLEEADRLNALEIDQEMQHMEDDDAEIQETEPSPSRHAHGQKDIRNSPITLTPGGSRKGRSRGPLMEVPPEDVPTAGSGQQPRGHYQRRLSQGSSADGDDDSLVPTQATAVLLAVEDRQEQERNKENTPRKRTLLDRQEGAERIEFDSQEPSSVAKEKRRREETDDDDYENDHRQKSPRRSEHRPPMSNTTPLVLEDTSESEMVIPGPSATQPARPRPVVVDRAAPPSSTAPQAAVYDEIKSLARTNTTYLKSVAPLPTYMAPSQSRRAWTTEEVQCLIEMVAQFGCKWSHILKVDKHSDNPRLQDRSQVQLKDKARNMKLDYLKAEMPLPENFASVTISRAHKEELDRLGLQRGREARFEDGFVLED